MKHTLILAFILSYSSAAVGMKEPTVAPESPPEKEAPKPAPSDEQRDVFQPDRPYVPYYYIKATGEICLLRWVKPTTGNR